MDRKPATEEQLEAAERILCEEDPVYAALLDWPFGRDPWEVLIEEEMRG